MEIILKYSVEIQHAQDWCLQTGQHLKGRLSALMIKNYAMKLYSFLKLDLDIDYIHIRENNILI